MTSRHLTSRHEPARPGWRCEACGDEWPCRQRRNELTLECGGNRLALAVLMARYYAVAVDDHPGVPASVLYLRFLGWLPRPR
jgi:hypothetical protein